MGKKEEKSREYAKQYDEYNWQLIAESAYEEGWDEALKNQWISVEERLPEFNEKVFTLYKRDDKLDVRMMRRIQIDASNIDYGWRWSLTQDKYNIIAWMPIPSFDDI